MHSVLQSFQNLVTTHHRDVIAEEAEAARLALPEGTTELTVQRGRYAQK